MPRSARNNATVERSDCGVSYSIFRRHTFRSRPLTMGWFSSSSSPKSDSSNDSAAPSRSERKACWDSRDRYFGCLDKAGVSVPGQEGDNCKQEDGVYRDKCAASWVSHSSLAVSRSREMRGNHRRTPGTGAAPNDPSETLCLSAAGHGRRDLTRLVVPLRRSTTSTNDGFFSSGKT